MPVRLYGNSGELLDCLLELCGHMNRDELFDAYMRRITGLISADTYGFYVYDNDGEKVTGIGSIGVEKSFLDIYEKKGREIDPLFAKVKAERTICCSDQLMSLEEWCAHPAFKVFGMERMEYLLDAPLCLSGQMAGTLHFSRVTENGPFGPAEVRMVEILSRFIAVSMSNGLRYSAFKRESEIFRQAMHCSPEAMVITDRAGEIRFMNRSAGEMFGGMDEGTGEDVVQNMIRTGLDFLGTKEEPDALEDGRKLVRTDGNPGAKAGQKPELAVSGSPASAAAQKSGRTADSLVALREEREDAKEAGPLIPVEKSGLRASLCALPGSTDLLLAFLRKAEKRLLPIWEQVLSNREKEILRMVCKGMRNREIADAAFVSANTVKRHLDNMYAKLDVSGRASLVAKAFGLGEDPQAV
ncbi:MAG: helix-turn-helix transcriptional regulator [Desulfovibrio sp.]|nr:helix-turn-helix transcriptional regulator [Desulfovibrio sp.]